MTDITQTHDNYPEGVYQLAVTDPVLGGPEGPDNKAAIALANRTNYQRTRNVTPWRAGLEHPYPADAYCFWAGTTWKSVAASANVPPGTDATKWIRWAFTQQELDAYLASYTAGSPNLAAVINNSYIGPDPTVQRVFTQSTALSDLPVLETFYTLQTLIFTGARRARITGHAAFINSSTPNCGVVLEFWVNGSNIFGGHYLGAAIPASGGTGETQIPISISDLLVNLNPASTYTLTLKGKKKSAVGPIRVVDTYLSVEYN